MLSEITSAFEARNPGVASFETFAADCMAAMQNDPANAAAYLLLGLAARQVYDRFADQPLTVDYANESKTRMIDLARKAQAAIGQDATSQIAQLNDMARKAFSED
ncbi:MAG: hypothetical protein V3S44_06615 [Alphaproteobacteria bacterium]